MSTAEDSDEDDDDTYRSCKASQRRRSMPSSNCRRCVHDHFGLVQGVDDAHGAWRKQFTRVMTRELGDGGEVSIRRKSTVPPRPPIDVGTAAFERVQSAPSLEPSAATSSDEDSVRGSSDSDASDVPWCKRHCKGFYSWLVERMSDEYKMALVLLYVVADCAKFEMFEYALLDRINPMSVFLLCDVCSAFIAFGVSVWYEGFIALHKIFEFSGLRKVSLMAALFALSTALNALAYGTGLAPAANSLIGKLYLPLTALASWCVFKRKYGKLEWLSLSMTVLGIAAFMFLRDRCHLNNCLPMHMTNEQKNPLGITYVILSVTASAFASIFMEKILHNRNHDTDSEDSFSRYQKAEHPYHIYRAQLDLCTGVLWFFCMVSHAAAPWMWNSLRGTEAMYRTSEQGAWFGAWTKRQYFLVLSLVAQKWLAGLVVQLFSTVSRGMVSSVSVVLVVDVGDYVLKKYSFNDRFIPSFLITIVVLLSGLIFQTGRLNVRLVRDRLMDVKATNHNARHSDEDGRHRAWSEHIRKAEIAAKARERLKKLKRSQGSARLKIQKYAVVIAYILADSFRSIISFVVQSNRFFVPQTMAIMSGVAGVTFASVMTWSTSGREGLVKAWDPKKIVKFLICGGLQAVTTSLMSMAYALGTSPALVVALGKVYTPLVAIFSRWILGRYFSWLEWFALIILTAASFAFGLMDTVGKHGSSGGSVLGMFCVIGSATSSCLMSLAMEKLIKSENDPFIMQKVRLDFGSILFSVLILPVMGFVATLPGNSRQDLAFWVYRPGPDYWDCQEVSVNYPFGAERGCNQTTGEFMANWTYIGDSAILKEQAGKCVCGSGIFLGWGSNYLIYVGVAIIVFHSWVTGKLVTQFSSVFRAVADGIPVLLIYFFLEPVFSRVPFPPFPVAYSNGPMRFPPPDWARDLVCLILPLSGTTFSSASAEMKKVVDAIEGSQCSDEDEAGNTDVDADTPLKQESDQEDDSDDYSRSDGDKRT